MKNRKEILLKAAHTILKKCADGYYVKNALEETALYDGVECDGQCLLDDIAAELGIEDET